jgi:hypothetical protein
MYARGIVKDMRRMTERGKSIHDVPKFEADD